MGFPTRLSGQLTRLVAIFGVFLVSMFAALDGTAAQNADGGTPVSDHACDALATPEASTTESEHGSHGAMEMDFDLMYIDMMILHHGSVVALANVALPELTDPRLQEMAGNIISAQSEEITQLTEWRTEWYGSADPMPMDEAMMDQMMVMMPGMGDATDMMNQMDADYQVSTFCAASDPDLAFIELVIPHDRLFSHGG
jgi:uncharacterized protein (DUF305 family)